MTQNIETIELQFTDRYGGNSPAWLRGCHDRCEAMGFFPLSDPTTSLIYSREHEKDVELWKQALSKGKEPDEIGYIFVKCPTCKGTGMVSWLRSLSLIPAFIARGFQWHWLKTCFSSEMHPPQDRKFFRKLAIWWECSFGIELAKILKEVKHG